MLFLTRKVEKTCYYIRTMTTEVVGNYIRAHRRKRGLTQLELGILVGYGHGYAVGKHERSRAMPPFHVALAYEIIFEIPVAQLFTGFHSAAADAVARNLQDLKAHLDAERARGNKLNPEKLEWLSNQKIG